MLRERLLVERQIAHVRLAAARRVRSFRQRLQSGEALRGQLDHISQREPTEHRAHDRRGLRHHLGIRRRRIDRLVPPEAQRLLVVGRQRLVVDHRRSGSRSNRRRRAGDGPRSGQIRAGTRRGSAHAPNGIAGFVEVVDISVLFHLMSPVVEPCVPRARAAPTPDLFSLCDG